MKCKKIVALALTGVMTLAVAAPVFAAGTATKITGSYNDITIDVAIQATGTAVINPYSMPYQPDPDAPLTAGTANTLSTITTGGKIVTRPLVMYNKTANDLSVSATVTASVPTTSGVELVSTAVKDTATEKQAQVYLEVKRDTTLQNSDIIATPSTTSICGLNGANVITAFNAWPTTPYVKTNRNQVLVSADESTTKENLAVMAASTIAGSTVTANSGSFILYRLAGTVSKKPEEAWNKNDKFEVNVAFTFSPPDELPGGAITATDATLAANKLAVAAPTGVDLTGATYKWEIVDAGETGATTFADAAQSTSATPTIKGASTTANPTAGIVKVKCSVKASDGFTYVSTGDIELG